MNCSTCKTPNDDQYVFCVNCGGRISGVETRPFGSGEHAPPTVRSMPPRVTAASAEVSEPTVFVPSAFRQTAPAADPVKRKSPVLKIVVAGLAVVILIGVIGGAGLAFWFWQKATSETLPDHLGLFAQTSDRSHLDELKKLDAPNALEAKDGMLKNDGLPLIEANPTVILYSDGKDVPIGDLRLIQLDTIKDDGSFKQIEFQASPVDGKPEMKRLRIPDGIANGKYAFALIDGYLNEGKHKFWPFQVKASSRGDNGALLKPVTVSIKPTPTPAPSIKPSPTPGVPPPTGGTVAYSKTSNLILRNGPSQDAYKIRTLRMGEKVYILRYSENSEVFDGIEAKFAYIQTESGQTGWVFSAFLR